MAEVVAKRLSFHEQNAAAAGEMTEMNQALDELRM